MIRAYSAWYSVPLISMLWVSGLIIFCVLWFGYKYPVFIVYGL